MMPARVLTKPSPQDDRTSLGSNRLVTVDLPDKLGGRTFVDIYLYVSDVGSGVRQATMTFTSTTQSGFTSAIKTAAFAPRDVFSGSTHSGVMKASSWFEFSDEPGRWGLRSVVLEDNAGNWRIYTDLDLLLFAHMVNATLDVHGSEDQYLGCHEAKKMRCVSNARCYNQVSASAGPNGKLFIGIGRICTTVFADCAVPVRLLCTLLPCEHWH